MVHTTIIITTNIMAKIHSNKNKLKYIFLFLFIFFISCSNHIYIKEPVSRGDVYYLDSTYYSDEFQGKKTSSGEKFDKNQPTCAAHSFPPGTILEVKNLANDKSVIVRVNDTPGKNVIDLSESAFLKIADKNSGKIAVKIKVIGLYGDNQLLSENSSENQDKFYTIQIGAFTTLDDAKKFRDKVKSEGVYIYENKSESPFYRVRVGKFNSKENAKKYAEQNLKNLEFVIVNVKE